MHQKTLIKRVANQTAVSERVVMKVLSGLVYEITESVAHGEPVRIRKLGVFYHKDFNSRELRVPKTGKRTTLPPRRLPKFSPYPAFKARVTKVAEHLQELPAR